MSQLSPRDGAPAAVSICPPPARGLQSRGGLPAGPEAGPPGCGRPPGVDAVWAGWSLHPAPARLWPPGQPSPWGRSSAPRQCGVWGCFSLGPHFGGPGVSSSSEDTRPPWGPTLTPPRELISPADPPGEAVVARTAGDSPRDASGGPGAATLLRTAWPPLLARPTPPCPQPGAGRLRAGGSRAQGLPACAPRPRPGPRCAWRLCPAGVSGASGPPPAAERGTGPGQGQQTASCPRASTAGRPTSSCVAAVCRGTQRGGRPGPRCVGGRAVPQGTGQPADLALGSGSDLSASFRSPLSPCGRNLNTAPPGTAQELVSPSQEAGTPVARGGLGSGP